MQFPAGTISHCAPKVVEYLIITIQSLSNIPKDPKGYSEFGVI